MASSPIRVTKDRVKDVTTALNDLADTRVMLGIPAAKAGRREGPISNAELGYIHEFGAPEANIPARPFLVPGARDALPKAVPQLKAAATAALEGRSEAVQKRLNAAGLEGQNAVRRKITTGPFLPLSDRTLAARRARGVTRTNPLIDTTQLRSSLSYVLRKLGVKR